jgi:hypothetical protein
MAFSIVVSPVDLREVKCVIHVSVEARILPGRIKHPAVGDDEQSTEGLIPMSNFPQTTRTLVVTTMLVEAARESGHFYWNETDRPGAAAVVRP